MRVVNSVRSRTLHIPISIDLRPLIGIFAQEYSQAASQSPILNRVEGGANLLPVNEFLMHIQIISKIHA